MLQKIEKSSWQRFLARRGERDTLGLFRSRRVSSNKFHHPNRSISDFLKATKMQIYEYRITLNVLSSEEAEEELLIITLSWIFLLVILLANICACMGRV